MSFSQIISHLDGSIWAIEPNKLRSIVAFLNVRLAGGKVPQEDIDAAAQQRRKPLRQVKGNVAVLPVFGTLIQRAGMLAEMSGAADPVKIGEQFDEYMADDSVGAIVLHVDSPGGSIFGIHELSQKIYDARGRKRIIAVSDGYNASAAYYISSSADEVIVSPSSITGSIGTMLMHIDVTGFEEKEGLKTRLYRASLSENKARVNPFETPTEEVDAKILAELDKFNDMFLSSVARNRGVSKADVIANYGKGDTFLATDAVRVGLADRVGTFESVLQTLTGSTPKRGTSADVRRRRMELVKKTS